jgi:hypothetical protein
LPHHIAIAPIRQESAMPRQVSSIVKLVFDSVLCRLLGVERAFFKRRSRSAQREDAVQ